MVGLNVNQVVVTKETKSHTDENYCPRPEASIQYFRQSQQRNSLNGKKPPPDIRTKRGFAIRLYSL